jgi:ribonucleotide reductase alpha subunit
VHDDGRPHSAILSRFVAKPGEGWKALCARVASIAPEPDRASVQGLIECGHFVPAGQILRGAGIDGSVLYNCFVSPIGLDESARDISGRVTSWTRRGCGVGVNVSDWIFSQPSPSEDALENIVWSIASSQQGLWNLGISRTATMVNVGFWDAGVVELAARLASDSVYRHVNLGVLVDDATMAAATEAHATGSAEPELRQLRRLAVVAHATGNPGLIYIDQVNRVHPFAEKLEACNPCAEQYLAPSEGCNLGSINLVPFVQSGSFDWERLRYAVLLGVRFLDSVVDASSFPSTECEQLAHRRRRIGLGFTGLGTALAWLGVPYGSKEAVEVASVVARELQHSATIASIDLASQIGPYPELHDLAAAPYRRNSYLTSIAPTGAISLIWNVSSGIEPVFASRYTKGSHQVVPDTREVGRTALQVHWREHLNMLSAVQHQVDGGVSKTVNLPKEASLDEVLSGFIAAWQQGCKGVSFFRHDSRAGGIQVP